MPLTSKGEEIKENMEKEYGSKKGEKVFYASKNKGTISGVDGVGMECQADAPISPYYGDPPLDPTSIAPPPNSNAEQPSGMKEPVDGSTFNPPPIGDEEGPIKRSTGHEMGGGGSVVQSGEKWKAKNKSGISSFFRNKEEAERFAAKDAEPEMSPADAFAAFGARADQGDAWSRMTGSRDFSGDEHSGMGRLPREVSFKQMRGMAEGFGYNQGNQGDPYKK